MLARRNGDFSKFNFDLDFRGQKFYNVGMSKMKLGKTMSIQELLRKFSTEHKCIAKLESVMWPGGKPVCPSCLGRKNIYRMRSRKHHYRCKACANLFNVKTGTPMQGTKLPLQSWMVAMYLMVTSRKGISALQLSRELGITHTNAWYLGLRIRRMFETEGRRLKGIVETDQSYVGGKEKNKRKHLRQKGMQGGKGKMIIHGEREREQRGRTEPARTRLALIPDVTGATLFRELSEAVESGSLLMTDEHRGYSAILGLFRREGVTHSDMEYGRGRVHINGMESIWALMKRAFHGTYHSVSIQHIDRYLREIEFRLNEGNGRVNTQDRLDEMMRNMPGRRLTRRDLAKTARRYRWHRKRFATH